MKMSQELKQLIASKVGCIETLERQNSDSFDFHNLAVWQIEKMLEMAFDAGVNANK
ncbi:MAG: hypothetical protein ABFD50_08020 [Smithella sp.]